MEKEQLFNYIREENLNGVQGLLQKEPSLVREKDQRGSTPLLLATYYGHTLIAKEIMKYDGDLYSLDGRKL